MTPVEAITILIEGVRVGQQNGIYTLEDAKILADAISVILGNENAANTTEVASNENLADK